MNPVFGQTETKTPLMPSSGGIGSTNEGTGSVEMTFGQVIYQNEGNKFFKNTTNTNKLSLMNQNEGNTASKPESPHTNPYYKYIETDS